MENMTSKRQARRRSKHTVSVGFFSLFKFAKPFDIFMMFLGGIGCIGLGITTPLSIIVLGEIMEEFVDFNTCLMATNYNCTEESVKLYNDNVTAENETDIRYVDIQAHFTRFSIYFMYVATGAFCAGFLRYFAWSIAVSRQIKSLRLKCFQSLLYKDMEWFEKKSLGDIKIEMNNDINNIQDGIDSKLALFIQEFTSFIASTILGFVYAWHLSLVILSCLPVAALAAYCNNKQLLQYHEKERKAYSKAGAVAHTAFAFIDTVAAYGNQENEVKKYDDKLSEAEKLGIRKGLIAGATFGVTRGIVYLTFALAFLFGWKLITEIDTSFSPARLYMVFFFLTTGTLYLSRAAPYLKTVAEAKLAAEYVYQSMEHVPNIQSKLEAGYSPEKFHGDIEFRNVSFSYPLRKSTKVIKSLNIKFGSSETVAIVGPSGTGKSTLALLMQRIYDPSSGKILLDGRDIREYNVQYLRSGIGVVQQNPILFNATIEENIKLGSDEITDEDMHEAAKIANAFDFIQALPRKFATSVGKNGSQLSGGQMQRVCLARELARKPSILILDETTSALDTESEAIVLQNLKGERSARTTIFITSRLTTVRHVDIIFTMDGGEIVEQGTHEELMKNKGTYFSFVTLNSAKDQVEYTTNSGVKTIKRLRSVKEDAEVGLDIESDNELSDLESEISETEKDKLQSSPISRILSMNRPEWHFIVGGVVLSVLCGVLLPIFAYLNIKAIMYLSIPSTTYEGISIICPTLAAFFLLSWSTGLGMKAFFAKSGEKLTRRLREKAFGSLLNKQISWHEEENNNANNLENQLSSDASRIQSAAGVTVGAMLEITACAFVGIFIAFYHSWKLALVTLGTFPLLVASQAIIGKVVYRGRKNSKKATERANEVAMEAMVNYTVVMSLCKQDWFLTKFKFILKEPLSAMFSLAQQSFAFGLGNFTIHTQSAIVFVFSGYLLKHNSIDFFSVFIVILVLQVTAMMIGRLAINISDSIRGRISAFKIFQIIDDECNYQTNNLKPEVKGGISFNDCTFAYPSRPNVTVLDGLNVQIQPGNTLALIGQSGCGKSTTVRLLERFYELSSGNICLDGMDIREFDINHLRRNIGIVFQHPTLFDGTIEENIAYGIDSETFTKQDIINAAQIANIHDFITSLNQGYQTQVTHGGNQLSRGQKQRISLARALIRDPKILLLDEATSSLDIESEMTVQHALDRARIGRTCIIIAHRLSTIRNADVIAVMSKGKIVESGNHDSLMEKSGIYRKLIENVKTLS